ncbi:transcription initiation factor IIA large subunit [Podospora australis]|uniref:Transcription initiation factor IIA large subunit n=1 Tax=Podospora australis TaxID=1536484 RepID=A0AAN7ANP1_9PEZI|nr:transcription initiation factor IIA large subunit [Podospora australis]
MSNQNVGAVYDIIIQEVINSVRVDFEETGTEEGVLDDLKKKWQIKLSQMNVATFPWDPKPELPPQQSTSAAASAAAAQAAATPVASYTQSTLSPQVSAQPISLPGHGLPHSNGLPIKQEAGLARTDPSVKQEPGLDGQAGQQNYALHPQQQQHLQNLQQQHQQRPGQVPQQLSPQQQQQQQYRQGLANAMQQQRMQAQGQHIAPQNGLPAAQHDGATAYEGILMQRDANGNPVELSRVEIDNMLHAQILARGKQMEGGGLMLPLKQATRNRGIASKRDADASHVSAHDGGDDELKDEDLDDDAINSDLDDPNDDKDDDDDEDDGGHMMLCMYDKVQRVKNKWKCTLKDGVLTVNGREYVFHKATGEYEW